MVSPCFYSSSVLLIIFPILIVMATSEEVGTDWTRSAGDMSCTGPCQRKRLPASEFSESQVKRALEGLRLLRML